MKTRNQYIKEIQKWYDALENKSAYCFDLSDYLEGHGFKKTDGYSIYSNWMSRGNLPKETIKLNHIHEFTKNYKGNANSETREPEKLDALGGHVKT